MDTFIHGRDDPSAAFLLGVHEGHTPGSKHLMAGEWRDATYAEYCKLPLENCFPLNEDLLLGKCGYKVEELADIARLAIPFGGLSDINVKPGETVIVAPATGGFGMGAVKVALAMGARVIAMGRNTSILSSLSETHERIETVAITGDMSADYEALKKFGVIDAFFDISPPAAAESTHFKSAMLSLRHGGRVSLMGGLGGDLKIPHSVVMHRDLCLRGKWMYSAQNVRDLVKMIETGLLRLGEGSGTKIVGRYRLEEWEKAFDEAKKNLGKEDFVVMMP
jgi:threonine dehydrogenase-like Zn-dependent dehydrogenase